MPSTRRMILGHVMSGVCTKMNRTKQLPNDLMETPLNRCLTTFDITLLGKRSGQTHMCVFEESIVNFSCISYLLVNYIL